MAVLEAEFESKTLLRSVSFRAILPLERFQPPYPAIYLLHGLGGSSSRSLHYTNIRGLAEKSGIEGDPALRRKLLLSGRSREKRLPR